MYLRSILAVQADLATGLTMLVMRGLTLARIRLG